MGGVVLLAAALVSCTVQSAIQQRYSSSAYLRQLLGEPVGTEAQWAGVRVQDYQRGVMYWTPATGAHEVHGGILQELNAIGGVGVAGLPITDETPTPDGIGRFNHFSNGYSIYWSPQTGAHEVHGAIRDSWAASGWEQGPLGYPTTDETHTPDGFGRYNHFSKDGSIYWTPFTGAHALYGPIFDTWASLGWERSALGYPTSDVYMANGLQQAQFVNGSILRDPTSGYSWVTRKDVLTVDGGDSYSYTWGPSSLLTSAPATNRSGNLRTVVWDAAGPDLGDGQVCATWAGELGGSQEGLALHIRQRPDGTVRAVTVTKNIYGFAAWVLNIHVWDSSLPPSMAFSEIGRVDLGPLLFPNDVLAPLPWHVCARIAGDAVQAKVWLNGQPEPAWGDPAHGGSVAVPAGWLFPGKAGWYSGHIAPGGWEYYTDMSSTGGALPVSGNLQVATLP